MRRALPLLVLVALGACMPVMMPVGAATVGRTGGTPVPTVTLEREMHQLVNQHRVRRGLPALQYDERVAEIAREHSAAMASRARPFGHAGFDQRGSALARFLPYRGLAENVAYDGRGGADLSSLVVEGWIGSAAHRQNIEGAYEVTGIGVARDREGVVYATQIFLRR
jgi:uncharacterized protein YkwD